MVNVISHMVNYLPMVNLTLGFSLYAIDAVCQLKAKNVTHFSLFTMGLSERAGLLL